jgi:hypothetical protein
MLPAWLSTISASPAAVGLESQKTVPASVKLIKYSAPLEFLSKRSARASEKVITNATIKPIGVAASSEAVTE